jgi:diguanylate cyclase (GGDEF)-like protein/PAS domain S-box-containing protein
VRCACARVCLCGRLVREELGWKDAMTDRTELLESALDSLPDGLAVFGAAGEVVLWNHAAEAITGYASLELLRRPVPGILEALLIERPRFMEMRRPAGAVVRVRHKLGHEVPVMARSLVLRDGLGERIGMAAMFHPADGLDALPLGEAGENMDGWAGQAELDDRMNSEFDDFLRGGLPFGVLWIGVDQAERLRRTHGAAACAAMLAKVEGALRTGLRPAEEIGRWGEDEFLVIARERTAEMLAAHAQTLAGLARTADFRWWGDRVTLTVSIGAAQAESGRDRELAPLLERARKALIASLRGGGNRITSAGGSQKCLPS